MQPDTALHKTPRRPPSARSCSRPPWPSPSPSPFSSRAPAAAAPQPIARDLRQQSSQPELPVPTLTAHPSAAAVELRWTELPGATQYELWVWCNEETGWQLVSDALTGAAFTHTQVTPGAACYYAIRALDASRDPVSAWSQYVPATVPTAPDDQIPPPASTPTPTSTPPLAQARTASTTAAPQLTARPAPGAVQLSWPEHPGAAAYELWTWWDRDVGWQFISNGITQTHFTHASVTPDTTYHYALRALDAAGKPLTGWSNYASAIPLPPFTPTPTTTPTSTPASDHGARAHPDRDPDANRPPPPRPRPPTRRPRPPRLRRFRQQTTPTPTPDPNASALPAPELTAQPAAAGEVRLSWKELSVAARYELWTWWDRDTGWQFISNSLTGASFTHTDLTPGTTYYYALRVLDAAGNAGPWSDYASATVSAASAITTPSPTPSLTPAPASTPSQTPSPTLTPTASPTPSSTASPTPSPTPSPTATLTLTPTLTPTPTPHRDLPPPPASLGLDRYYRKYIDAGGIPVVAPPDVPDLHLYHARDIINAMLSHRPDLRATMTANRFRVVIYKHDGCRGPYQTPELRAQLPPGRCTNILGTATIRWLGNRFTGEVLLIIDVVGTAPAVWQQYCNVILVHEFAHMVHYALAIESARAGTRPLFDSPFDSRLKSAYNAALAAGLYPDAYASTNYLEYWAEAVMFWFLPDMLTGEVRTPANVARLADYDPRIAAIVQDVFRAAALPECEPIYLKMLGKVTAPDGRPSRRHYRLRRRARTRRTRPRPRQLCKALPSHKCRRRLSRLPGQDPSRRAPQTGATGNGSKRPRPVPPLGRRPPPMGRPHRLPRRLPRRRQPPGRKHLPPKRRRAPHPPIRPRRHHPHNRPQLLLDPQTRLLTHPQNPLYGHPLWVPQIPPKILVPHSLPDKRIIPIAQIRKSFEVNRNPSSSRVLSGQEAVHRSPRISSKSLRIKKLTTKNCRSQFSASSVDKGSCSSPHPQIRGRDPECPSPSPSDDIYLRDIGNLQLLDRERELLAPNRRTTMLNINPKYLVNEKGRNTAAVLSDEADIPVP